MAENDEHKHHKKEVLKTIGVILGVLIIATSILSLAGVFTTKSGKYLERADSICFLMGYAEGVDGFQRIGNTGESYSFNCSTGNSTIMEYNKETNRGKIEFKDSKKYILVNGLA